MNEARVSGRPRCHRRGDDEGAAMRPMCGRSRRCRPRRRPLRRPPTTGPASMSVSTAAAAGARPSSVGRVPPGSLTPSGGLVGGTVGYNLQMGQTVFGLEGDLDWSNMRGSPACCVGSSAKPATTGSAPRAAASVTPSIASCPTSPAVSPSATSRLDRAALAASTDTKAGWTLGGGLEAALAGPWTAKVEYLYVDLGQRAAPSAPPPTCDLKPTSCAPV